MLKDELKPCPFCGGKAYLKDTTPKISVIVCEDDKCSTSGLGIFIANNKKELAIKAWNTRKG